MKSSVNRLADASIDVNGFKQFDVNAIVVGYGDDVEVDFAKPVKKGAFSVVAAITRTGVHV